MWLLGREVDTGDGVGIVMSENSTMNIFVNHLTLIKIKLKIIIAKVKGCQDHVKCFCEGSWNTQILKGLNDSDFFNATFSSEW